MRGSGETPEDDDSIDGHPELDKYTAISAWDMLSEDFLYKGQALCKSSKLYQMKLSNKTTGKHLTEDDLNIL